MLMNVQVAHPTTATRTQIVITLMAHSTALVKVGTVAMVVATATVCIVQELFLKKALFKELAQPRPQKRFDTRFW